MLPVLASPFPIVEPPPALEGPDHGRRRGRPRSASRPTPADGRRRRAARRSRGARSPFAGPSRPAPRRAGPRRASGPRRRWVLRIAAVLVIGVLGGWNLLLQGQLERGAAPTSSRSRPSSMSPASPGALTAVLRPRRGDGPTGLAAVERRRRHGAWPMRDLAPTTGTQVYEAWVDRCRRGAGAARRRSTVGSDGTGVTSRHDGRCRRPGVVLALTLEPARAPPPRRRRRSSVGTRPRRDRVAVRLDAELDRPAACAGSASATRPVTAPASARAERGRRGRDERVRVGVRPSAGNAATPAETETSCPATAGSAAIPSSTRWATVAPAEPGATSTNSSPPIRPTVSTSRTDSASTAATRAGRRRRPRGRRRGWSPGSRRRRTSRARPRRPGGRRGPARARGSAPTVRSLARPVSGSRVGHPLEPLGALGGGRGEPRPIDGDGRQVGERRRASRGPPRQRVRSRPAEADRAERRPRRRRVDHEQRQVGADEPVPPVRRRLGRSNVGDATAARLANGWVGSATSAASCARPASSMPCDAASSGRAGPGSAMTTAPIGGAEAVAARARSASSAASRSSGAAIAAIAAGRDVRGSRVGPSLATGGLLHARFGRSRHRTPAEIRVDPGRSRRRYSAR